MAGINVGDKVTFTMNPRGVVFSGKGKVTEISTGRGGRVSVKMDDGTIRKPFLSGCTKM